MSEPEFYNQPDEDWYNRLVDETWVDKPMQPPHHYYHYKRKKEQENGDEE